MAEIRDAINQMRAQFDAMESALDEAKDRLEKTMKDNGEWEQKLARAKQDHAALVSELEAKKLAADRAAEESAKRIKLNNDQVAEITRIRAELDKRDKAVAQREQAVAGATQDLQRRLDAVVVREAELIRKEAEIRARYAKMKEAMA